MNNRITINVGNEQKTFFLQNGFYFKHTEVSPIHKHYYTEIHIVIDGNASYTTDKKTYNLESGDILVIPPNALHSCSAVDSNSRHCSFMIDCPVKKVIKCKLSPQTLKDFFDEIDIAEQKQNYAKLSAYLSLIYNTAFESKEFTAEKIVDYSFIIEEYLKINYAKDIKLSDLAAELNLSEKHTERLIKKFTGNTFKQELSSIRIKTAQMLLSSTDMSMTEISEYVGYNSYSGFYKAYKKNI